MVTWCNKFRKIIGKYDFPCHFKKIIVRYKKIGYNKDVLRQTASLVVNPIKVNYFAYLFDCTLALHREQSRPVWKIAVHLAVACDVYDGVFLCCPFSHKMSWMKS